MFLGSKESIHNWRKAPWMYAAAFFMSFYGGIYMVSLPFVIALLGGTDKDLGLCASLGFVSYLVGCTVVGPLLDRFDPRRLAQCGSVVVTIGAAGAFVIVLLNVRGYNLPNPVILTIIATMLCSSATSIYWPPIMGWLSTGHEGKHLNRRLGIYNVSWSAGLAVSPFIAGLLIEAGLTMALFAAIVFAALAFVAVTLAHPPELKGTRQNSNDNSQIFLEPAPHQLSLDARPGIQGKRNSYAGAIGEGLPRLRWTARIALVGVFTCVGLMKTQLALLFTMELGFSASQFGTAMTILCVVNCLVFLAASKIDGWHYRLLPSILAQLAVLLGMFMIIKGSLLITLFFVAALVGFGQAFTYVSHQFYAASQSTKRSGSMALHEILLSAGQIIGFVAGGYLADSFGRRAVPYWFGLFVVAIGIIAQLVVWYAMPIRQAQGVRLRPGKTRLRRGDVRPSQPTV